MTLLEAARQIDAYAGECAEPDVQPLGTVAVPVRYTSGSAHSPA